MRCLYCQKRLWNPFAKAQFCSPLHETWHREEQSGEAIRRLMEPAIPVVGEEPTPEGAPDTTAAQLSELQNALWQPAASPEKELPPDLPVPVSRRYANEVAPTMIGKAAEPSELRGRFHTPNDRFPETADTPSVFSAAGSAQQLVTASASAVEPGPDDPPLAGYLSETCSAVPPPLETSLGNPEEMAAPGYVVVPDGGLEPYGPDYSSLAELPEAPTPEEESPAQFADDAAQPVRNLAATLRSMDEESLLEDPPLAGLQPWHATVEAPADAHAHQPLRAETSAIAPAHPGSEPLLADPEPRLAPMGTAGLKDVWVQPPAGRIAAGEPVALPAQGEPLRNAVLDTGITGPLTGLPLPESQTATAKGVVEVWGDSDPFPGIPLQPSVPYRVEIAQGVRLLADHVQPTFEVRRLPFRWPSLEIEAVGIHPLEVTEQPPARYSGIGFTPSLTPPPTGTPPAWETELPGAPKVGIPAESVTPVTVNLGSLSIVRESFGAALPPAPVTAIPDLEQPGIVGGRVPALPPLPSPRPAETGALFPAPVNAAPAAPSQPTVVEPLPGLAARVFDYWKPQLPGKLQSPLPVQAAPAAFFRAEHADALRAEVLPAPVVVDPFTQIEPPAVSPVTGERPPEQPPMPLVRTFAGTALSLTQETPLTHPLRAAVNLPRPEFGVRNFRISAEAGLGGEVLRPVFLHANPLPEAPELRSAMSAIRYPSAGVSGSRSARLALFSAVQMAGALRVSSEMPVQSELQIADIAPRTPGAGTVHPQAQLETVAGLRVLGMVAAPAPAPIPKLAMPTTRPVDLRLPEGRSQFTAVRQMASSRALDLHLPAVWAAETVVSRTAEPVAPRAVSRVSEVRPQWSGRNSGFPPIGALVDWNLSRPEFSAPVAGKPLRFEAKLRTPALL